MEFVGFSVEGLDKGDGTIAESRWVFALPVCSPIVLVNSEVRSFDICITLTRDYNSPQLSTFEESKSLAFLLTKKFIFSNIDETRCLKFHR